MIPAEKVADWSKDVDGRVNEGIKVGLRRGIIKFNDPVVIVTGWQQGSGFTNTMRVIFVPQFTEQELKE